MKKTILIALLGLASQSHATGKIPERFQGKWTDSKASCKMFEEYGAPPNGGAHVKSTGIIQYEYYCELKKVISSSAEKFSGHFSCMGEGEEEKVIMQISRSPSGTLTLGGGPMRVRCN
jgi:hypothetical protein